MYLNWYQIFLSFNNSKEIDSEMLNNVRPFPVETHQ